MRKVGGESRKTYQQKLDSGFFEKYCKPGGLDIGYSGYEEDVLPILWHAIGVDLTYPGYNGVTLPFSDASQNYIYSSHVLEHIAKPSKVIKDWFRVLKPGGHIVTIVPHRDLYEKKLSPPSNFNGDHKNFYTPSMLLWEFENALPTNSFRVRHMQDNDFGHDYNQPATEHSLWCYEIELVIQKL